MLGSWQQNYDPLNSWQLSALVSVLPLATLFYVFLVLKKRVWIAALSGMGVAFLLALVVFRMPPAMISLSALMGIFVGWLRVAWMIIASIFLYNIAVATGQFQVMKKTIARLSPDKRLQVIVVAFCLGAYLEGTGSGGAPVAMTGALLVGLGFPPQQAAKVCLLANTVPLAWGGIGNPIHVLAVSAGLSEGAVNAMAGRILPVLSAVLPLWLVNAMVGWRRTREVLPAVLVIGVSFALIQGLTANLGYYAWVDIAAATTSLASLMVLLRSWRPPSVLENDGGAPPGIVPEAEYLSAGIAPSGRHSVDTVLKGWSSVLLACAFISVLGVPGVSEFLSFSTLRQPVPFLNNSVIRTFPVVSRPVAEPAIADLNLSAMHGTAVFLGATLSGLILGVPLRSILRILYQTVSRLTHSLLGVSFMVGFLFIYRYSGMITVIGLALTKTGAAFPFFGVFLGWLGVTLSGSDSVSNSMFGYLQRSTAERAGLNPVLMAAANASGGVLGKMMDPQSLLVSTTATQQGGKESEIFKTVFKHSLILTALVGALVLAYAFLCPGLVPNR